ncbi:MULTISPECIES: twin-arginine translocase TatA/TatE family subunit [unclassified Arthrobacter]|uniref:twin-arginine translocase TatA/TatE family subunit n=1 Tax=unclassified Arthrobacter TaxID=235627 RepID=UPI00149289D3|nr:twin-arginine translocase TatA/TatE family subunit [Arthrobacter sp. AET 35A]MBE0008929.1 Sec-independent protein translocase TatB [Arthrobacter sp. AET 35A]NOJ62591.1 Sec-independent protein translocase TatB [Arthrobacter sp. 147(2020)]
MFGINGLEFLLLAVIAVMVLGPERLPEYAGQLGRLVKDLRRMATGAREQLRDEVGPELDEVDWRKLDPRQYDPRRIIKEALLDDVQEAFKPVSGGAPGAAAPGAPASAKGGAVAPAGSTRSRPMPSVASSPHLAAGEPAPFDLEAT